MGRELRGRRQDVLYLPRQGRGGYPQTLRAERLPGHENHRNQEDDRSDDGQWLTGRPFVERHSSGGVLLTHWTEFAGWAFKLFEGYCALGLVGFKARRARQGNPGLSPSLRASSGEQS